MQNSILLSTSRRFKQIKAHAGKQSELAKRRSGMAAGSSVLNVIENKLDVHGTLIHLPKVYRGFTTKYIKKQKKTTTKHFTTK